MPTIVDRWPAAALDHERRTRCPASYQCGTAIRPGAKFCGEYGQPLVRLRAEFSATRIGP
jgi:hypothetical protein